MIKHSVGYFWAQEAMQMIKEKKGLGCNQPFPIHAHMLTININLTSNGLQRSFTEAFDKSRAAVEQDHYNSVIEVQVCSSKNLFSEEL